MRSHSIPRTHRARRGLRKHTGGAIGLALLRLRRAGLAHQLNDAIDALLSGEEPVSSLAAGLRRPLRPDIRLFADLHAEPVPFPPGDLGATLRRRLRQDSAHRRSA